MVGCFAVGCRNHTRVQANYFAYHRIPRDPWRQQQWLRAIGKDPATFIYKKQTVCSYHFTEDQYKKNMNRRELLEYAIPNVNLPMPFVESNDEKDDDSAANINLPLLCVESSYDKNIENSVGSSNSTCHMPENITKDKIKDVELSPRLSPNSPRIIDYDENVENSVGSTNSTFNMPENITKHNVKDVELSPNSPRIIEFFFEEEASPASLVNTASSAESASNSNHLKIKTKRKYHHHKSSRLIPIKKSASYGTSLVKRSIMKKIPRKMHSYRSKIGKMLRQSSSSPGIRRSTSLKGQTSRTLQSSEPCIVEEICENLEGENSPEKFVPYSIVATIIAENNALREQLQEAHDKIKELSSGSSVEIIKIIAD